jgi:5,10-methylenetetrahydrofolate reductase
MVLESLLRDGRFAELAELRPPKGAATEKFVAGVRALLGRVDAIVVRDNPDAVLTLDGRTAARLVLSQGVEPVLGVNCRDRNRLALQADLLGAFVDGVRVVAVETGGDPSLGDHPGTRGVYDVDAERLVEAIRRLAAGSDLAGGEVDGAPRFLVGAEFDPWKPAGTLGADFVMTCPVFDVDTFEPVAAGLARLGVPAIVRIVLLKSGGMARYIQRSVAPGRVADATIEKLQAAPDKEEAAVALAAALVRRARAVAAGVCLVPLGWDAKIPAVLDAAR